MQDNNINEKNREYTKEMKTLIKLFGDLINKEELQQKMEYYNENIELVIKEIKYEIAIAYLSTCLLMVMFFLTNKQKKKDKSKPESTVDDLENVEQVQECTKEIEKTEVGEVKPGINLQGYCTNETCLASKAKLPVWVNIGFDAISFVSSNTSFSCPDCKKLTVSSIVKTMFYNSEHSICTSENPTPLKDNNYQCSYAIKSGLLYELKANKIIQHAKSIEDLRERSEQAMNSTEIKNLVTELQKYEII
ncbi:hypothetical protein RFI_05489, partial [Reticulomyxa filosa]